MRRVNIIGLLGGVALLIVVSTLTITSFKSAVFAQSSINVLTYNGNRAVVTNTISPRLRVVNKGPSAIHLTDVKIRYYFTEEGNQAQHFWCDWSTVGASHVTGTFFSVSPVKGVDHYLEIGFTGVTGTLTPGASIEVQTRIAKSNWSNYNQANDYSFNQWARNYVATNKVTAYVTGTLNWGVVPIGLTTVGGPPPANPIVLQPQPSPNASVVPAQPSPSASVVPSPSPSVVSSPPPSITPTATTTTQGTFVDNYFPLGTSINAMKSGAANLSKQQVKILIEQHVDAYWGVVQSTLGFTTKEKAYAFFLGLATRESTFQAALETGSGPSDSYGPLQTAQTAYANNNGWIPEKDVPEIPQYALNQQNFYDVGIAVTMGIRHILHNARQSKAAGFTGIQFLRHALIGYNTGFVTNNNQSWLQQYSDEIGALAGWYLTNNHLYDTAFSWTGNSSVNRSAPWGWY